jgi:adenosine/AMP kinase
MQITAVAIQKPADMNVIIGQSHFIKTVEDLHEAIVNTNPSMKFGLAFCEASGPCLVRFSGNDPGLITIAQENALRVGCGHTFFIFLSGGFPLNILNAIKQVPEVCTIFCATANPLEVLVAESGEGRGIAGVIDGARPKGIETDNDIAARKGFLRKIGYKFS